MLKQVIIQYTLEQIDVYQAQCEIKDHQLPNFNLTRVKTKKLCEQNILSVFLIYAGILGLDILQLTRSV